MLLEFSAKTFPNVLQADCISVVSEVGGLSFGCRPSYSDVVFEFDHEGVNECGARLLGLLCSEGG